MCRYPLNDVKMQAKIDEYLDYHHTGTRKIMVYLFNKNFAPLLGLKTSIDLEQALREAKAALKFLD